jgi:transposase
VSAYQDRGEAGLRTQRVSRGSGQKLPGPAREKIVEIKKREPLFGVKRISHLLKRAFFLSASPETVRRTLQEESLIVPSKRKPRHNILIVRGCSDVRSRITYGRRTPLRSVWGAGMPI